MLIPAAATSARPLRPLGALLSGGGPFERQSGKSFRAALEERAGRRIDGDESHD